MTSSPKRDIARFCIHSVDDSNQAWSIEYITCIILAFRTCETADHKDSDNDDCSQRLLVLTWQQICKSNPCIVPHKMHRFCDNRDGDVEKEDAQSDGKPEEEGFQPSCP